ncbi:transposase [Colletotrichum higginsianum]|uniref:Transposase n=1 Tax=Colletotrichum higginsianum (strain IMI 349063) TaxID=759273 RepID=H1UW33_COLHI|nr:transposase [Colletotrichum higginsianum]
MSSVFTFASNLTVSTCPAAFSRAHPRSSLLPTDGSRVPTIAYLDQSLLRSHRKASLQHIYFPRSSKATARLYHRRPNHITPSEPVRDPYIVALLIALAQSQRRRYCDGHKARPAPKSFNTLFTQVHALVGGTEDRHYLVVYTAHVPAAALDRCHKTGVPEGDPIRARVSSACSTLPPSNYANASPNQVLIPSASSHQVSKGQSRGKKAEGWASASSVVVWSTPRKANDLTGQLKLFTELDNDASTQRLLFMKVKKGFSEQAYKLATAQQKLELLQAQVTNTAVRKRRAVQLDPNTKFANIKDIQQAQIKAGEKVDNAAESSDSDLPSEAGSCIVVASR